MNGRVSLLLLAALWMADVTLLVDDAQAGAAAPWARLVKADPLANNAAILVDVYAHGKTRFEVWAGDSKVPLKEEGTLHWRRTRAPSEGQGSLWVVAPAGGQWPLGEPLEVRVFVGTSETPRWRFSQTVGAKPDHEAPRFAEANVLVGQKRSTTDTPIFGKRTFWWVSFTKVIEAQSSRVLVKLKLAKRGQTTPTVFTHTISPGAEFAVPLPADGPYEFWGATLVDTAGNATTVGRPPEAPRTATPPQSTTLGQSEATPKDGKTRKTAAKAPKSKGETQASPLKEKGCQGGPAGPVFWALLVPWMMLINRRRRTC